MPKFCTHFQFVSIVSILSPLVFSHFDVFCTTKLLSLIFSAALKVTSHVTMKESEYWEDLSSLFVLLGEVKSQCNLLESRVIFCDRLLFWKCTKSAQQDVFKTTVKCKKKITYSFHFLGKRKHTINTHLNCWFCLEDCTDKNNAPQKERNTTTKTAINLVTSRWIILAKVFVYNPVVLEKDKRLSWIKILSLIKAAFWHIYCQKWITNECCKINTTFITAAKRNEERNR